ncbi:pathogenicity island 1 protein SopD2, partial [Salmonella enterica subsp. enterica serovar Heidelberg]
LIYLLHAYKPSLLSDLIEANTRRIYRSHDNTLFISKNSTCRNMLI